jgi:protein-tyrosine phosphatase
MVELSDLVIFNTTEGDFKRLQEAGMLLVITHPERNPLLRQRLVRLKEWVKSGCYLQVTGQSLFGRFGDKAKEFAEVLMNENLVHFIASDGHDVKHRPPVLKEACDYVAKRWGPHSAEHLFKIHPASALTGEPLDVSPEPKPLKQKKRFLFW